MRGGRNSLSLSCRIFDNTSSSSFVKDIRKNSHSFSNQGLLFLEGPNVALSNP